MAIYAIGDIQGCHEPLKRLLNTVDFDPARDHLWVAGDLVNRGPKSLQVLRFLKGLGHRATCVLGNHDLHLLAVYYKERSTRSQDTLDAILKADDAPELIDWLRHQPLVHLDEARNWCMSHAGIPPQWSARKARKLAQEVEAELQGDQPELFFQHMYGNQPSCWHSDITGFPRKRLIVNYLTRMRFIDKEGALDLTSKEGLASTPKGYKPWFKHADRKAADTRILFGHWAALEGRTGIDNVYALDTGCVWGGHLTALRLDDLARFSVPAHS